MFFNFIKNFFIISLFIFIFIFINTDNSYALISASDRISLSGPGITANHTINFKLSESIPASGKIIITPESGFFVEPGFDYTDVDLAVSGSLNGPYIEKGLSAIPSAINDGVMAVASTSDGSIVITLNSSSGMSAGTYVQVLLGTNAVHGAQGDKQIINPGAVRDYNIGIYVYDAGDIFIERSDIKVYIIEPVTMGLTAPKSRSHAAPIGYLTNGTTQTIMSLYTNFTSHCRYSAASGTPYAAMENDFSYATTSGVLYHTVIVGGLENGQNYDYYVRCMDEYGVADDVTKCSYTTASTTPYFTASGTPILEMDCIDYYINFNISTVVGGVSDEDGEGGDGEGDTGTNVDDGGGTGSGSGGGGGAPGSGDGSGLYLPYPPLPGDPGVILEGYAFPNKEVVILKDGIEVGRSLAGPGADFGGFLADLTRGVYTFSLWADDADGLRSNTFSTTFWIDNGTQTTVSDIILSPTISSAHSSVTAGDNLETYGYSVPGSKIETWMYLESDGDIDERNVLKSEGVVSDTGKWTLLIDTGALTNGVYLLKARTIMGVQESGFSRVLEISVGAGEIEEEGICSGADLNHDGRVNLTDFSILLYHWGTNDACADQNHDGNVDLTDFSIMMYYWTG